MTTLTAESSPELSGFTQSWIRLIALFGVGPVLALVFGLFLVRDVKAAQEKQAEIVRDTNQTIHQHVALTNDKLDLIARQLAANCRVQALIAKSTALEAVCEVGR
jgi:low affinity Fe/Cu permease